MNGQPPRLAPRNPLVRKKPGPNPLNPRFAPPRRRQRRERVATDGLQRERVPVAVGGRSDRRVEILPPRRLRAVGDGGVLGPPRAGHRRLHLRGKRRLTRQFRRRRARDAGRRADVVRVEHAPRGDRVPTLLLLGALVERLELYESGLEPVAVERRERSRAVDSAGVALEPPLGGFDQRHGLELLEVPDARVGDVHRGPLAKRAVDEHREPKVDDAVLGDFTNLEELGILAGSGARARHQLLGDVRGRAALISDRRHERTDPAQPALGAIADDHPATRLHEPVESLAAHPPDVVCVFVVVGLGDARQRHRLARDHLVRRAQRRLVPRGHASHRGGYFVVVQRRRAPLASQPDDSLVARVQDVAADRDASGDILHPLVLPDSLELLLEYELLDPGIEVRVVQRPEHRVGGALRAGLRSLHVADGVLEIKHPRARTLLPHLPRARGLDGGQRQSRERRTNRLALRLPNRDGFAQLLRPELPFSLPEDVLHVAVAGDSPGHKHPVHVLLAVVLVSLVLDGHVERVVPDAKRGAPAGIERLGEFPVPRAGSRLLAPRRLPMLLGRHAFHVLGVRVAAARAAAGTEPSTRVEPIQTRAAHRRRP